MDYIGNFHTGAKQKGGFLKMLVKDDNSHKNQGFDRIYKIIQHEMQPEWVYIQPRYSYRVLNIMDGLKGAGTGVVLEDISGSNDAELFKMLSIDDENNTYYLINKNSGLYLEVPAEKETETGTHVEPNEFTGSDNHKWVFEDFDLENIAPPSNGYYTIRMPGSDKYWYFPGTYPD